jgi:hypothetical protein
MNFTPKVPLNSSGEYAKLDGLSHLHHGPDGADSFHLDSSPQDGHLRVINVPDAHLLFSGDYTRSGSDLILSDDLHHVVLPNYFASEKRPMLLSPEGAAIDHTLV